MELYRCSKCGQGFVSRSTRDTHMANAECECRGCRSLLPYHTLRAHFPKSSWKIMVSVSRAIHFMRIYFLKINSPPQILSISSNPGIHGVKATPNSQVQLPVGPSMSNYVWPYCVIWDIFFWFLGQYTDSRSSDRSSPMSSSEYVGPIRQQNRSAQLRRYHEHPDRPYVEPAGWFIATPGSAFAVPQTDSRGMPTSNFPVPTRTNSTRSGSSSDPFSNERRSDSGNHSIIVIWGVKLHCWFHRVCMCHVYMRRYDSFSYQFRWKFAHFTLVRPHVYNVHHDGEPKYLRLWTLWAPIRTWGRPRKA